MRALTQSSIREILKYEPKTGLFRWRLNRIGGCKKRQIAGGVGPGGYIRISVFGQRHLAHRLAWLYMTGSWPEHEIDHKNLRRADNVWRNLRQATDSQNRANENLRINNKSGYRGVSWKRERRKWCAQISIGGSMKHLGLFDSKHAAAAVYAKHARKKWGSYFFHATDKLPALSGAA